MRVLRRRSFPVQPGRVRPAYRPQLEWLETRDLLSAGPEQAAGQSINALGQDLYSLLQGQSGGSGNLFLSPASIATALAMTDAGARGETASQISSVLHAANVDPSTLAQEFGSLLTDLNSAGQGQYALAVADALWGQQGFPFNQAFLNLVQADYGGGLHQVDFVGNPEGARQTINAWVAQRTADKIQNLFPQGTITPDEKLVLTNAIYFNGDFATPFYASNTNDANFTLFSGDQERTPTMHQTGEFGYMASDGYQVLELPYVAGRFAIDVILPSTERGMQGLDVSRLPADLSTWLSGLSEQQVAVSLPKFSMTTQFDLSAPLRTLGMTDAFSDLADFSGISPIALKISNVLHKAYINVTETGTEAAAATGVMIATVCFPSSPSPSVVFNADHPFLFLIRDTQSGSVLFEGQVANPTSAAADPSAPPIPVSQLLVRITEQGTSETFASPDVDPVTDIAKLPFLGQQFPRFNALDGATVVLGQDRGVVEAALPRFSTTLLPSLPQPQAVTVSRNSAVAIPRSLVAIDAFFSVGQSADSAQLRQVLTSNSNGTLPLNAAFSQGSTRLFSPGGSNTGWVSDGLSVELSQARARINWPVGSSGGANTPLVGDGDLLDGKSLAVHQVYVLPYFSSHFSATGQHIAAISPEDSFLPVEVPSLGHGRLIALVKDRESVTFVGSRDTSEARVATGVSSLDTQHLTFGLPGIVGLAWFAYSIRSRRTKEPSL
jgi:serpin B